MSPREPMPLSEARAYVYEQLLKEPWKRVGDDGGMWPLLHALISLGIGGDDQDRDVARSILLLCLASRYQHERDAPWAKLAWFEARFYLLLSVFQEGGYPIGAFTTFAQRLDIDVPAMREASEALCALFGATRAELLAAGTPPAAPT